MNLQAAIPDLPQPATRDILGVSVARVGWDEAQGLLRDRIVARRFTKVGFLNAHNANVACADADFSDALSRFLVLPDGVGVDVAARLLYGARFPANLNGTDFVPALLKSVDKPLKVGLLGATRRNADAAAAALARIAPQHAFTVVHDGFFTVEQDPEILDRIANLRPDVLLVAMGVPRQEFWIDRRLTSRHCTLPVAVGALLDFLSGAVPRAPLWVRRLRMEWLYRLVQEPGRLWRRYIVGNPLFLTRVLKQKLFGTRSSE